MSGTLGIAPIRTAGAAGIHRLARSMNVRRMAVIRRGGLTTPVAVAVAMAVTAGVVWVTAVLAGSWGPA